MNFKLKKLNSIINYFYQLKFSIQMHSCFYFYYQFTVHYVDIKDGVDLVFFSLASKLASIFWWILCSVGQKHKRNCLASDFNTEL